MARTARFQLVTPWAAVLFVGIVLARVQGRSLAEQNDASLATSSHFTVATEGNVLDSAPGSTSAFPSSSNSLTALTWFQQQLSAFAALEHAVMQRLNQGMLGNGAPYEGTQEELLRHVGCARMRAAMLNKAMQQGSEAVNGPTTSSSVGGGAFGEVTNGDLDGEEYFEDYSTGTVSSRAAYAGNDAHLRGAVSGDAAAVANGADEGGALLKSRALSASSAGSGHRNYGPFYDYEESDSSGEDAEYEMDIENQYIDAYEYPYNEYYVEGYFEYEYDEEEVDDIDTRDVASTTSETHIGKPLKQSLVFEDQYTGLEGRVLKLLEGAYAMMFGDQEGTAQGTANVPGSQSAGAAATGSLAASVASSDEKMAASSAMSVSMDDTTSFASAADFGYDSYDMLDQADAMAGLGITDGEILYFGYEYDLYNDYYETITLADIMLSEMDMDAEDDEWADYLEQAYEYFTLYMDDGDELTLYAQGSTSADMPSALAALATIAELVVWAHLGNFELEVRPAYTVSTISDDGSFMESNSVFFISTDSYSDSYTTIVTFDDEWDALNAEQPVEVVNDMSLRWTSADGSLNWGLVTLILLSAGTCAMLVGCVASWFALRRTMSMPQGWVYVPPNVGKRCCDYKGSCGKGKSEKGFDGDLVKPLTLRPEDCQGAVWWGATVAVEDASEYVSPKLANDSVAKALYK